MFLFLEALIVLVNYYCSSQNVTLLGCDFARTRVTAGVEIGSGRIRVVVNEYFATQFWVGPMLDSQKLVGSGPVQPVQWQRLWLGHSPQLKPIHIFRFKSQSYLKPCKSCFTHSLKSLPLHFTNVSADTQSSLSFWTTISTQTFCCMPRTFPKKTENKSKKRLRTRLENYWRVNLLRMMITILTKRKWWRQKIVVMMRMTLRIEIICYQLWRCQQCSD